MHYRPPDPLNDFGPIKNENLLYKLYVIREIRRTVEAFAASKWLTYLTFSLALGGSAPWLIKTYLSH